MTNPKTSPVAESMVVYPAILLPPACDLSAEYLEGWCDGQAYLLINQTTRPIEDDTPTDAGEGVESDIAWDALERIPVLGTFHQPEGHAPRYSRSAQIARKALSGQSSALAHPTPTDIGLVGELIKQARYIRPYLNWTIGAESPGYHPTMPSAVAAFTTALDALSKAKDTPHG